MATISSSSAAVLSLNPSTRIITSSLSSSSSVFFSYNNFSNSNPNRGRIVISKKRGLSCNCLFGLGVPEIAVIAGVVALVFGPKKLPEVGRSIGKTLKGFQQCRRQKNLRRN
ncbi:hypothetical protein ABFS82_02G101100 [Erythranthe guttata]|uniref:sec-independent protein translocase protein TATA, chloroplastic-like isoform X2 n=1 Tax=Erythranthe guttata TaxID=4155 RepID=UPI00064E0B47|nr:PREDICTED: sec-independent protein translocase protein TATA, chloroplastic-like isoform X2 [Erythranthe guttata]|eukprot:XP_012855120.1 PREDICTED: sec-independent protein translocase protein TATA, chloroplastic-like isoform X2 [Erythranthe guttata]